MVSAGWLATADVLAAQMMPHEGRYDAGDGKGPVACEPGPSLVRPVYAQEAL